MKKDYNQYYTSSLFNIKNKIDYSLKTICINLFTNKDIEIFNKIKNKIVIYNNSLKFFKYLDIVKKVIQSGIPIYSNNIKIRRYLYENGAKPKFIEKKYIQVDKNIDLSLFNMFKISSDEKYPLVIKYEGNNEIIMERLIKKLPTIVVDKINIYEIEEAVIKNKSLYVENCNLQLYVAEHLSKTFGEDFTTLNNICINFEKFSDKNKPCVFYGIFSENDVKLLESITSYKIIIWTGGDINIDHNNIVVRNKVLSNLKRILNVKDVYHIAISNSISNKLDKLGIIYKVVPFMPIDLNKFMPVKKGKSIYVYVGNGTEVYGRKLYTEIYKRLKNDYSFIFAANPVAKNGMFKNLEIPDIVYIDKENIQNIYSECFIGFRFTIHDGLSASVQELGCMGIKTISNLNTPSTINYRKILDRESINDIVEHNKAIDDIINKINDEYEKSETIDSELSNKVKKFLTIEPDCFNENFFDKQKTVDYLYIHNYDFSELYHASSLFNYTRTSLCNYFHIIGIKYIDTINLNNYKCVILDPLMFIKSLNNLPDLDLLLNKLNIIKNKVMLFHDLHDFSFDYISNYVIKCDVANNIINLNENDYKKNLKNFLVKYDIKYTISIYECYENILLNKSLNHCINKSYLLSHCYNDKIFYNRNNKKIYDILIYGNTNNKIYPFRERLLKICKSMNLNIMEIKHDYTINNSIVEDELSILINKSWLSISCCLITDYFVRKYLEIISSGSIVIGNINDHGRTIIENAFVEVNDNYSDELIKSIITYYLNNKDLLIYLSMKSNNKIKNYKYDDYSNNLNNICNSITNNTVSEHEYKNILNKKLKNIDKTSYDYKIINIQNNTEYIQPVCKCSKCIVINLQKCGEYYLKSNNVININIENNFIREYNNIYYDGNYCIYFTLIKPNYKLNLNLNNNIIFHYIEKYNRFDIKDKTSYDYKIINIQNNTEYIQPVCKCSKCIVINLQKCGEYYLKSNNVININIENNFIREYNNIYYDGNYCIYFTLIKPNYKLNLNLNNNIIFHYIEKYNHIDIKLYNKDSVIQYINIASFLSKGFKNPILSNYNNLNEYNLSNNPSFFYGMRYDDEFKVILNKNNLSIVIYTGGDANINDKNNYNSIIDKINILRNMPNVRFISISSFISSTLKELNIPYIYLPFMGIELNKFEPCVKGNSIYIYTNHIGETYGRELYSKIMEKYKNINFLLYTHPAQYDLAVKHNMTDVYNELNIKVIYNIDELIEVYKKCFIGLRLTKFDGLAATVQELGCMGIKSIHNGSTPSSLNYNDFDDICNLIDNEMKTIGTIDYELSDKVKKFLTIDPIYFNENYYYNNINYYFSKIYILNLKRQDKKRETIIRIMEKHNINNYTFFEAIDGYTEPYITDWEKYNIEPFDNIEKQLNRKKIGSAGVWGNLISVRDILITAKKNNENRILFFEDDIILHNDFNKEFTENIRQVPSDWLIILLGAGVNQLDSSSNKINKNIYKCGKNSCGGFAICINSKIYDELINECNKFNAPFDSGPLNYIINKYYNYCYLMYPNIVICNVEESTLRNDKRNMKTFSNAVGWNLNNFEVNS